MAYFDDKLFELNTQCVENGTTESAPAPMATPAVRVVVDSEGNGTVAAEVPRVDHSEVQKRTKSSVDPSKVDLAQPIRLLKSPREIKLKVSIVVLFCIIVAATTCILVLYVEEPLHYKVGQAVFYAGTREFALRLSGTNITRGLTGRNLPDMLPSSCNPLDADNLCLDYPGLARFLLNRQRPVDGMDCYSLAWEALNHDLTHRDCYAFEGIHWYGGSVSAGQRWPLERMNQSRAAFVSGDASSSFGPVLERFWVSSHGVGIRVSNETPLFVSVNEDGEMLCLESTYQDSPFPNPDKKLPRLEYTMCSALNIVSVHQGMMKKFNKTPGVPQAALQQSPMWSTPACGQGNSWNETAVLQFARAIQQSNLGAKSLEIHCDYAAAEGELWFDAQRFPTIAESVAAMQGMGLSVAVRLTPFVNTDSAVFQEGLQNHFLVRDPRSQVPGLTRWENGVAGLLDATSPNATAWFLARLERLQNATGVGLFTFDYGQVSYLPVEFQTAEALTDPCTYTQRYVGLAAQTQSPVVVRSAFQSQDIPAIVLTTPKSVGDWGYDNGLKSVIPTALTLGLLGYPYVMPDLDVGCLGDCLPSPEFLLRWLGLTAFLPAMRVGVPIWEYDRETVRAAQRFVQFHQDTVAGLVLKVAGEAEPTEPVVRPLWWLAPDDPEAQAVDSEFLIGNDMLVAPVLEPGQLRRRVYLPVGKWLDQLHGSTLDGGTWVEVDARLDQVPYFTTA